MEIIKWLGIAFLWLVGLILYNGIYHPYQTKRDLIEALKWIKDKIKNIWEKFFQ